MKNHFFRFDWTDMAALAGFGMIFYGLYLTNLALAFVVCGVVLLLFGIAAAYQKADKN